MTKGIQIAIDGPAAAGKSTIARMTAEKLGYTYIDTGAMYRALTYCALEGHIDIYDDEALSRLLDELTIDLLPSPQGQLVKVDGTDVSDAIRSQEVTASVSAVAAQPEVRRRMAEQQRRLASSSGVVMDGRDIGTAVLPEAELKIFMTASVEERAERRYAENVRRGISSTMEELCEDIRRRDKADTEREASPLQQAADAVFIDTTSMSIGQVADTIIRHAEERMGQ
ncbi:cytidylate kinase [Sporosarcina sp. NCCP-2716]|uniref:(d)CMP kinase n=1 Tax=Sporosarcina sp. NCCP-2716 TaxID=2943679 RepID=UPI00203B1E84|nr:(d)CMP kinase [Sporosarcina sp. NCCP-2716]GKV67934.1 cytidylate kinase [Sporosarcina sp. NCCP-2716]